MSDLIHIQGLRLRTWIGVAAWEQKARQDILVDITITHDGKAAAAADDVELTVDYRAVRDDVVKLSEDSKHKLLETFAQRIADLVLAKDGVIAVRVKATKPAALRFSDAVAIEIQRKK